MRRIWILGVALCAACAPPRRPGIEPRNLVLVTFQELRADRTSTYLHARPTTAFPSGELERREERAMGIDDLAATGVVFANCMSPSPATVPALASLFTGRTPRECGVETDGERVPWDVPTLAELFTHAGFKTAAFATQHDLDLEPAVGRGFSTFRASADDDATLAAALDWIELDPGDGSRRFVWIHLAGLVPPFEAGAHAPDVQEVLARRSFGPEMPLAARRTLFAGTTAPDPAGLVLLSNAYDHEVARASTALARFLTRAFDYSEPGAEESETWARTVFTFTAPTGIMLGEDGLLGAAPALHERMLHVPLVIRHPDSLTGQRVSSAVVDLTDLLPTFVEWFDLATPRRVEGRSLLALLDSYVARPFEHRPAITVLPDGSASARDERFHLRVGPSRATALFEPGRDLDEREDVSRQFPREFALLREAALRAMAHGASESSREGRPRVEGAGSGAPR